MKLAKQTTFWVFAFLILCSAILYSIAPISAKTGVWTHAVLRNWEELGCWKSGGKLIHNPGGMQDTEQYKVYPGHRPYPLILAYAVKQATGAAGADGMLFYVLLTLLAAFSAWQFLGKDKWALLATFAATVSAGYMRTLLILDPVTIPIVLGFPFAWLVARWLEEETITWTARVRLVVLTFLFAVINWTTVFVFAIILGYLVIAMPRQPLRWVLFGLVAGAGVLLILIVSIKSKANSGEGQLTSFAQFYNAYLFGTKGYHDYPMNWSKALVRIGAVTLIGLLPLIGLFVWSHFQVWRKKGYFEWASLLPLCMAFVCVFGMRNYFAHHPWMAAPPIILGFIASLRLLWCSNIDGASSVPAGTLQNRQWMGYAFLICCFLYGFLVVTFLKVNSSEVDALVQLVHAKTQRHDLLYYSPKEDQWIADEKSRLEEILDRKLVEINEIKTQVVNEENFPYYVLTAVSNPRLNGWVSRDHQSSSVTKKVIHTLLNQYRRWIAKREPGDRMQTEREVYLYSVPRL